MEEADSCPPVDLDVSWLVDADLHAVDALARLHVVAARRGRTLHLHGADPQLRSLIELTGLCEALRLCRCPPPPGSRS